VRTDKTRWFLFGGLAAGAAAVLMPACGGCDIPLIGQSYVFDAPSPTACRTVSVPKKIEINRAADILFMIDNSGSMFEEQDNLAKNASAYSGGGACDLSLHASAVSQLKTYITTGAGRGAPAEQWVPTGLPMAAEMKAIYDDCGFIERLQLYDNDFQIGIVTTDARDLEGVGTAHTCGSALNYPNGRSAVPQRGCLQPIPGFPRKIIRPTDGDSAAISQLFRDAVRNVGTCGSGIEEGLKSIREFLTPDAGRADPSCVTDFQQFLRPATCLTGDGGSACLTDQNGQPIMGPEKKLVVIDLSDEEDCSTTNSPDGGPQTGSNQTGKCYTQPEFLIPTGEFVSFLRGLKSDPSLVSMAAIVGGNRPDPLDSNPERFVAGNCRCDGSGANAAPITACDEVFGSSNIACGAAVANQFCGTLTTQVPDGGTLPCCTADHGGRHVDVARRMDNKILDSICSQNYKSTMIDIANLINQADVVPLGEKPQDIKQLTVEVKKGSGDFVTVTPYRNRSSVGFQKCSGCVKDDGTPDDPANCSSGFALIAGCTQVKFLGSDIPPQGAEIRVSFLGAKSTTGPKCQ
jgi:hypothetical protein